MQAYVDLFQGPKESREALSQLHRSTTPRTKITMPEAIGNRDHRRTHGPIFMRPLRPRRTCFLVDPQRKAHALLAY